MRIFKVILVGLLFSGSAVAADTQMETLFKMQDACKLKQVTQSCSISSGDKMEKARCVDAKQYGLMCISHKS